MRHLELFKDQGVVNMCSFLQPAHLFEFNFFAAIVNE